MCTHTYSDASALAMCTHTFPRHVWRGARQVLRQAARARGGFCVFTAHGLAGRKDGHYFVGAARLSAVSPPQTRDGRTAARERGAHNTRRQHEDR